MYLITRPTTNGPLELFRFIAETDNWALKQFNEFCHGNPYAEVASLIRVKPDGSIALIA